MSYKYNMDKFYVSYVERMKKVAVEDWIRLLQSASRVYPDWRYFYETAVVFEKFNKINETETEVQKALIEIEKKDTESKFEANFKKGLCYMLLAKIRLAQKKIDESINYWKKASENLPFESSIYTGMALSLLESGKKEEAIMSLAQCYLCNPDEVEAIYLMSKIYLDMGNKDAALKVLQFSHVKFPFGRLEILKRFPEAAAFSENEWFKSLNEW